VVNQPVIARGIVVARLLLFVIARNGSDEAISQRDSALTLGRGSAISAGAGGNGPGNARAVANGTGRTVRRPNK